MPRRTPRARAVKSSGGGSQVKMRAAIYVRVSTEDQHCELQLAELPDFASRMGWEAVILREKESTRKRRPVLDQLMEDCSKRKFDVVLCWKLDRFGRSVQELSSNIAALDRAGVRFVCPSQSIDTDNRNPTSKLLLHILAAMAEFERDLIRERVTAGLKSYQTMYEQGRVGKGKERCSRSGKNLPPHRPPAVFDRKRALELAAAGKSARAIAGLVGTSRPTIARFLAAQKVR
jgi:putative DNA-invertase from lambdoid prophage Rac